MSANAHTLTIPAIQFLQELLILSVSFFFHVQTLQLSYYQVLTYHMCPFINFVGNWKMTQMFLKVQKLNVSVPCLGSQSVMIFFCVNYRVVSVVEWDVQRLIVTIADACNSVLCTYCCFFLILLDQSFVSLWFYSCCLVCCFIQQIDFHVRQPSCVCRWLSNVYFVMCTSSYTQNNCLLTFTYLMWLNFEKRLATFVFFFLMSDLPDWFLYN